jgi:hypothetical protein
MSAQVDADPVLRAHLGADLATARDGHADLADGTHDRRGGDTDDDVATVH